MAITQQQSEQRDVKDLSQVLDGVSNIGRKAQEVFGELAKLSEENLSASSKSAERLRDALSVEELTRIQAEFLKSNYESVNAHYRKIAEIAASTPREVSSLYSAYFSAISHLGGEAMSKAVNMTRNMGVQADNIAQTTAEATHDASQKAAQAAANASSNAGQQAAPRNTSQPAAPNVREVSEQAKSGGRH